MTPRAFSKRALFITGAQRPAFPSLFYVFGTGVFGTFFGAPPIAHRHFFQAFALVSPSLTRFHPEPPRWFPPMCFTATCGRTDRDPSSWVRPPSDQWQPCEGIAHTPMHGIALASLCSKDREKCACITLDACTGLQPQPFHHYSFRRPRPDRQPLHHRDCSIRKLGGHDFLLKSESFDSEPLFAQPGGDRVTGLGIHTGRKNALGVCGDPRVYGLHDL